MWGLYWRDAIHNLGRTAYLLSLVLALLTILVALFYKKLVGIDQATRALCVCAVTLSLIAIVDFSFSAFWFKDELFLISNLFWLVPAVLIGSMVTRKRHSLRSTTASRFLTVLLLPLLITSIVYVVYFALQGFVGLLVYFTGINVLAATYLRIVTTKSLHPAEESTRQQ